MFKQDIKDWINNYLSVKLPEHNGIARCPFAGPALRQNKINFQYCPNYPQLLGAIDFTASNWNVDVAIFLLDFPVTRDEFTDMHYEITELYNQDKYMFVDETQTLNGTEYNFILMHDFNQMQKSKLDLKKQGYYSQ